MTKYPLIGRVRMMPGAPKLPPGPVTPAVILEFDRAWDVYEAPVRQLELMAIAEGRCVEWNRAMELKAAGATLYPMQTQEAFWLPGHEPKWIKESP